MIVYAAITYTTAVLGIAACWGWLRTLRKNRRLRGWAIHWERQAKDLAGVLARNQAASRRGSHARRCQIAQERDLIETKAAQLRRELGL
jgi:hypothetical protein